MPEIYKPREDSFLLAEQVKKYAFGYVLDIGTGSGILALEAAKNKRVKKIIATDIQQEIINNLKKTIKNKRIKFHQSDLFSEIKNKKFDTIIFNPPYLPEDASLKDLTIDGGKKGYEILERFFSEVNDFLKIDGTILIVFSSLTQKNKVDEFIKKNLLEFEELSRKHVFFEDLYVYKIKKSEILKKLESNKIKNIGYFTKGHRGILFIADYKNKKVVIKLKNPRSLAVDRILNEIKYLKILNKKHIGPKILFYDTNFFIYEYIDGEFILDFFEKLKNNQQTKKTIKKILKNVFNQCFILDKLKIDKEEMHHPVKHVIINKKNKPVLLDFERAYSSMNPKNVTQFCQFLMSRREFFGKKGIKYDKKKIIQLAKDYKKDFSGKNFRRIIKYCC